MLQYIDVIANFLIMGNYSNELRRKIIRANNLLQFIHQATIEFRFRKSVALERFKSVSLNKKIKLRKYIYFSLTSKFISRKTRPLKTQRRAESGIRLSDHNVKKQSQHKQYNCPCNVCFYLGSSAGYSVASYLDLAMHHSKFRSRND